MLLFGNKDKISQSNKANQNHFSFRVKSCFAFNKLNSTVPLIDDRGCPFDDDILGPFVYDDKKGIANAQLKSMFRFPDSTEVHFQVIL